MQSDPSYGERIKVVSRIPSEISCLYDYSSSASSVCLLIRVEYGVQLPAEWDQLILGKLKKGNYALEDKEQVLFGELLKGVTPVGASKPIEVSEFLKNGVIKVELLGPAEKLYTISNLFIAKEQLHTTASQKPARLLHKTAHRQFQTFLRKRLAPYCHKTSDYFKAKNGRRLKIYFSYPTFTQISSTYIPDQLNVYYVKKIALDLEAAGFEVLWDRWQDHIYQQPTDFIEKMITEADYILVLAPLPPKNHTSSTDQPRAEDRASYESKILSHIDFNSEASCRKIVTCLLQGEDKAACLPPLLQRFTPILFERSNYFDIILKLIQDLYKIELRDGYFNQLVKDFKGLLAGLERCSIKELEEVYEQKQKRREEAKQAHHNTLASIALTREIDRIKPSPFQSVANKAYQHFVGNDEGEDQRVYDVWYSEKSIMYLLHASIVGAASPAIIPYVFINQATLDCSSFKEQFRELVILRNAIAQDICFIAMEPSNIQVPHYICGMLAGDTLLLINPVGISRHRDFQEVLTQLHESHQLTVYLSVTPIQKENKGLVSCGPICVELVLNLLAQAKQEWSVSLKKLAKSGKGKEQEDAWLHRVDISPLLPPTLQGIYHLHDEAYQARLSQIRAAHADRLIAISSTLPHELSEASFWNHCENAAIQQVMNQLCLEKKTIEGVQTTSAYQRLLKREYKFLPLGFFERQSTRVASSRERDMMGSKSEEAAESSNQASTIGPSLRANCIAKIITPLVLPDKDNEVEYAYAKADEALYTPLMGSFTRQGQVQFDLYDRIRAFVTNEASYKRQPKKYLLLLGEGGAGKSTFCKQFTLKWLSNYQEGDVLPLYIPLYAIIDPEKNLLVDYFNLVGFTPEEIAWLKQQKLLIFLDAYDEARLLKPKNIFNSINLQEWKKAKFVTTCRTSHLAKEANYKLLFMPSGATSSSYAHNVFEELSVAPFSPTSIKNYIEKFIAQSREELEEHEEKWLDLETYQGYMERIPGLKEVIQTPLFLKITLEILPEIASRHEQEEAKNHTIYTRRDLLKEYMARWFLREEGKLMAEDIHPGGDMSHKYEKFCQDLAYKMGMSLDSPTTVIYPLQEPPLSADENEKARVREHNTQWEAFFGDLNKMLTLIRRGVPLRKPAPYQYAFLHSEIQAYFNANHNLTATLKLRDKQKRNDDSEEAYLNETKFNL